MAGRASAEKTDGRAALQLRDSFRDPFLALLAAASVVAAAIVVAALAVGETHDWDLLLPLAAFALAGSVATITATLVAVAREPKPEKPKADAVAGVAAVSATESGDTAVVPAQGDVADQP